ncbi:hypothetical protein LSAT2_020095 [Lamellibrachia satsuma]|nr:hypothetical protein LSAT2_020095 [Lamellibrachia satsuma]
MEMVVACLCTALLGSPGMLMGHHRLPPAASQPLMLSGWTLPSVRSTLGGSTDKGAAAADPSCSCTSSASYLVSLSAVNTSNEHQLMQYTGQLSTLTGPGPQHHILLPPLNKMAAQYNATAKPPSV